MSEQAISLSRIQPDYDAMVAQLVRAARTRKTWTSFLTTDVGRTLIEFISAVGELDQYSVARTFEEMFSETAELDSSLYGITKMLGVRLDRKKPSHTYFRLPDASNSGSGNSGNTDNDLILKQAYLNPYYDTSIPLGGGATPASTRITDPILFWSYGKIKRLVSGEFPASSQMVIQRYTQFSSSEGMLFNRVPIKFDPITDIADPSDYGWYGYCESELDPLVKEQPLLYKGNVKDKFFPPSGQDFFSIISSESNFTVSDQDVEVFVNQIKLNLVTSGLWNYRVGNDSLVVQDITTSAGKMHILFGSDLYGFKPSVNDTIRLRYVTTNGLDDNLLNFKSTKLSSVSYSLDNSGDSCIYPLINGENETPASEYALLGPFLFASNDGQKGVTPQDYKVIFDTYPGNLDCAIDGQRALNKSSPAFMNLIRVSTYPKHTEAFNTTMFADVKKRTMYSCEFYTTYASADVPLYPIQRMFNIRAEVYCNSSLDLVSGRQAISAALLGLVDKINTPLNSKLNTNVPVETILKTMRESTSGINYIKLIEPPVDVVADMVPPKPLESLNTGAAAVSLTGSVEYAVEVFVVDDNQDGGSTQRSCGISDTLVVVGIGQQITIYFKKMPNFTCTEPFQVDNNISAYLYLAGVQYRLWRKINSVPNPEWEPASNLINESSLAVTASTGYSSIVDTGGSFSTTPPFPQYNEARPSVALLSPDWQAVNCISMFYSE
jgi:hypothetical protein